MDHVEYRRISDQWFDLFCEALEPHDEKGNLETEYQQGILTITLPEGKQFILSRHEPSQQIWLSSPISGGLHFSYNSLVSEWILPDGRTIDSIMYQELEQMAGIMVK